MALPNFNILFSAQSRAVIGSIPLDASIRERHSDTVQVTDAPIEDGSSIQDHAFEDPFRLTIDGFITDSPVRFLSGVRSIVEGEDPGGIIGRALYPAGLTRSASAFRALKSLKAAKQPITVQTGLAVYPNMVITAFTVDRDKTRGRALWFTMAFKQVTIVRSETIAIPQETVNPTSGDPGTPDKAASKTDLNKQPAQVATEQESTALRSAFDAVFGG